MQTVQINAEPGKDFPVLLLRMIAFAPNFVNRFLLPSPQRVHIYLCPQPIIAQTLKEEQHVRHWLVANCDHSAP